MCCSAAASPREWTARPGSPTRAQLAAGLHTAVAAVPDSLTPGVAARGQAAL
ncbi:hypothetical protein QIS99_06085 [Streptomyces sp. B-S-A8]|uniref:Uncharacterized protein n=1 Tax=Streptomyces solicavernae TaxID=3043614 RepID=A0ABT6RN02_9ACTN|nr:hypothetical protein [Streptomyces sp. B-S-A8]MDI3385789.1 hypothetical protein [Streptomyces sp. B-S-A8]